MELIQKPRLISINKIGSLLFASIVSVAFPLKNSNLYLYSVKGLFIFY